jgi:homoserine acetyltransferase
MPDSSKPTIKHYTITDFKFQGGTTLPEVQLAYLDLNPTASKVALIPTCFRGRLQSTLNFSNGALKEYRIIVAALFGNGESSSPSNTAGFPKSIEYRDCVRAQHALLTQHLGIQGVEVAVGFSMGGQCVYHWLGLYPGFVQIAVLICTSARTSRHNYQFLEGPRAALENSVDYADEILRQKSGGTPRGIKAFGKAYSAWLTSSEWFDKELYTVLGYATLDAWDADVTGKGYDGWWADDLLAMLRMWQRGDIGVFGSSLEEVLLGIKTPVLLMPCETDQYFDWRVNDREAQLLGAATLKAIPSVWGHLAGSGASQQDTRWIDENVAGFLLNKKPST